MLTSCFKITDVTIYLLYFFYFDEIPTFIKDVTVNWTMLNDSQFASVTFTVVVKLGFIVFVTSVALHLLVFVKFIENLVLLIEVWSDCFGAHSNRWLIVNFFEVVPVNLPFHEPLDQMLIQAIGSWYQYFMNST